MTQTEILNSNLNKTEKMKALFELGLTRREVATLMNVGYGFCTNVYTRVYGTSRTNNRTNNRITELCTPRSSFEFSFNRNFGVEIEAFNVSMETLQQKLNEAGIRTESENYNHTTREYWKVIFDGSLRGSQTFELVSPILNGQDGLNQLKTVCEVLKALNAKINKSCGLHIHFEARDFELNTWKNIAWNYATLETEIDSFLPASRRGDTNTYCGTMKPYNWQGKINSATDLRSLSKSLTNNNRYKKINFQSFWRHSTIEFRGHSGSIEFEKISNWILFLARLVEFSKANKVQESTFEGMSEFLTEDLKTYFQNRKTALAA